MSHLLWKHYWDDDVDKFRRLLAPAAVNHGASPGASSFGTSPRAAPKSRKISGFGASFGSSKNPTNLNREVNSRDHAGLTILLRAASSTSPNAVAFARALLEHPSTDIYAQDPESGWNALHRALYNGNISIARLLLEKERRDWTESFGSAAIRVGQLIKTKDHEGNSPFDVYNATIALRSLRAAEEVDDAGSDSDDEIRVQDTGAASPKFDGLGREVYTFGSNKNLSLGLGSEDDRQFPERIYLKRPDHLLRLFHAQKNSLSPADVASLDLEDIPTLTLERPLVIEDVVMSKLHSAIITTDPISNLYVCGIGRGGRLGLGDEATRFNFTPVQGGLMDKKIVQVALGQNHTMAVTDSGELWTFGSNKFSQLGYVLPPPLKPDEEPMSTTPRQVFGPLKKEVVLGVAASGIHSVAHSGTSLFTWGKNIGQLALMDADSRSLEMQAVPRRVAATLLSSHSSIVMVSAIDKATTCLFEDKTVCVFTSYGYNMIKFPYYDGFRNASLQRSSKISMSSRHDPGRREIHHITSGGETIAALTGSGDLYTMTLNQKSDGGLAETSTTNPSRIKESVTQPQCIWNSKKDGVKSVTVGENGSVMISTQSGAVWRRIKRPKAKDASVFGQKDSKQKDFKFQRVPYITDVAAVRSSTYGAFAAVRRDCDVTREQLDVDDQTLWDELSPLLPLLGFKANNAKARENIDTWKFQNPDVLKGRVDALSYEVLTSTDLEDDLGSHLRSWNLRNESLGAVVATSSAPELQVPIHSWVLSARSPILRQGLQRVRETGSFEIEDVLTMSQKDDLVVVEFLGLDLIGLLNLVSFVYGDSVIPAWNFTRQSQPLAYRYRQIRSELMKLAMKLDMPSLEAAVRLQSAPRRSMDKDLKNAIQDPTFFEDGDALLQLDGDEIPAHSTLLCQRCPWFEGLFNGRSRGMWLASRRAAQEPSERISIDMKHMDPESFNYVLQHLYTDAGEELFDNVLANNIDEFSELVLDVLSIANELMLDRLSQICQKIIGRFVSTRNVSTLLNLISPCSVTEFKDKGLEYICLQMESMLENHLLDNLEEDLLTELDEIVRDNQLARCPFARSGISALSLHERYPELAQDIDEERQLRVKEMAFKSSQREDERKLSSSYKARFGSLDDFSAVSPTPDRTRRKSRAARNEPFSPSLRAKDSQADLIFDMDEEDSSAVASPLSLPYKSPEVRARDEIDRLPPLTEIRLDSKPRTPKSSTPLAPSPLALRPQPDALMSKSPDEAILRRLSHGANPWGPSTPSGSRLDLRDIMTAAKPAQSALSAGIAAERKVSDSSTKPTPQKMSQKERKKQMLQQAEDAAKKESQPQPKGSWTQVAANKKDHPWQNTPPPPGVSIKAMLSQPDAAGPVAKAMLTPDSASTTPRRAASPDTRFSGQSRPALGANRNNSGSSRGSKPGSSLPQTPSLSAQTKPLTPHSKSYISKAPKQPEVEFGLGLADIIGEQERQQAEVREAVAKRSLQEIQQEQAFQEWWDQESRRAQEEEAKKSTTTREKKDQGSGRRGRGGKSKSGGRSENANNAEPQAGTGSRGRGRAIRGGKS